jgi:hypothetical protein
MQEGTSSRWIKLDRFTLFLLFTLVDSKIFFILYPPARSFFHTFREDHEVMHSWDLQKLEGALSPSHLEVI